MCENRPESSSIFCLMAYFEAELVPAWRAIVRAAHEMAAMHFLYTVPNAMGRKEKLGATSRSKKGSSPDTVSIKSTVNKHCKLQAKHYMTEKQSFSIMWKYY